VFPLSFLSRQRLEVRPAISFHHGAQSLGGDDLDLVSPLVQMPSHLEPARRMKPNEQASVVHRLENLGGMKTILRGAGSRLRSKPPNHFSVLRGILINAESLGGVRVQGKPLGHREALVESLRGMDPVGPEVKDGLAACRLPGYQIAAVTQQEAVRLDDTLGCVGRTVP